MKVKTSIGYVTEIEEKKAIDYETTYILGALQKATDSNAMVYMTKLLNKLFGSEEKVFEFFDYVKSKNDGIVSQDIVSDTIKEIFEALGNNKKK